MVAHWAPLGVRRAGQRPPSPVVSLRTPIRRWLSRAVTDDALRIGLAAAAARYLPHQAGQLTPHVLRHFAASDLYRNGIDVVAIQEILGHEWLNTTMIYVHVENSHVEDAWIRAASGLRLDSEEQWPCCTGEVEPVDGRPPARRLEGVRTAADARGGRVGDLGGQDVPPRSGWPLTVRLDDLDIICEVLDCTTAEVLVPEKSADRQETTAVEETPRQVVGGTPVMHQRRPGRSAPPL